MLSILKEILEELKLIHIQFKFMNKSGLTIDEAVEYSRIGKTNLEKLCEQGYINHRKIGVKTVISKKSIDDYLENGEDFDTGSGAKVMELTRAKKVRWLYEKHGDEIKESKSNIY